MLAARRPDGCAGCFYFIETMENDEHAYMVIERSCGAVQVIRAACSDPFCVPCERLKAGRRRDAWLPVLESMKRPRMLTLTMESRGELETAWKEFNAAFRRMWDMALGARNIPKLRTMANEFIRAHYGQARNDGKIDNDKYVKLVRKWTNSVTRFVTSTDSQRQRTGETKRIRHVCGPGFASREVTWTPAGWHVHAHIVTDGEFIPWPVLVAAWMNATRGAGLVVDIRQLKNETPTARAASAREVLKYVTKGWEIPNERRGEFRAVMHGKQRIKALGGAQPVDVENECPHCQDGRCSGFAAGDAELVEERTIGEFQVRWYRINFHASVLDMYGERREWGFFRDDDGRWRRFADAPVLDDVNALYLIRNEISAVFAYVDEWKAPDDVPELPPPRPVQVALLG